LTQLYKKNPFSLKNTTKHILADTEREVLNRELRNAPSNLIEEFKINEKEGDRLLYVISAKSISWLLQQFYVVALAILLFGEGVRVFIS